MYPFRRRNEAILPLLCEFTGSSAIAGSDGYTKLRRGALERQGDTKLFQLGSCIMSDSTLVIGSPVLERDWCQDTNVSRLLLTPESVVNCILYFDVGQISGEMEVLGTRGKCGPGPLYPLEAPEQNLRTFFGGEREGEGVQHMRSGERGRGGAGTKRYTPSINLDGLLLRVETWTHRAGRRSLSSKCYLHRMKEQPAKAVSGLAWAGDVSGPRRP